MTYILVLTEQVWYFGHFLGTVLWRESSCSFERASRTELWVQSCFTTASKLTGELKSFQETVWTTDLITNSSQYCTILYAYGILYRFLSYNTRQLPLDLFPPPLVVDYSFEVREVFPALVFSNSISEILKLIMPFLCIDISIGHLANQLQVLAFDAGGTLSLSSTLQLEWFDNHRIWELKSSAAANFSRPDTSGSAREALRGWRFPQRIAIPAAELWVPALRLANCAPPSASSSCSPVASSSCTLHAERDSLASLRSDGRASYRWEAVLRSRCELDLVGVQHTSCLPRELLASPKSMDHNY